MDLFTHNELKALLAERPAPFVSIYMPTHRGGNEGDPVRWRTHLKEAERRLASMRPPQVEKFLAPARQLLGDASFWKHQCDGLAFFLATGSMHLYRLPMTFTDLVTVGDRFHVTPLLSWLNSNGRFYILALSQNAVRLLQGTRDNVSEVDLKKAPRSLVDALLTHDRDEPLRVHSRPVGGVGSWGAIFSGQGVGIDDAKDDLLRYFQKIDRGLHPILRNENAPLVLAAVDYLRPIYSKANTYGGLLDEGIEGNPDRLSSKELRDRAWPLVERHYATKQHQAVAQYERLAGTGRTTSDLAQIVPAAYHGEIETLLVPLRTHVWGRFDPSIGHVEEHEQPEDMDEDLLNLAAVHTLRHGRTVFTLEPEQMPNGATIAAIFQLPLAKRGKSSR
jgi:hypothetical protein